MIALRPRYFILPLLALTVIGFLPSPAESGRAGSPAGCGPTVSRIADPGLRASFARFDRSQSAAADRVCEFYHNRLGNPGPR